jgi:hypothetical protein
MSFNFLTTFGAPGFEPGVARSQTEYVSRYTTLRCVNCLAIVALVHKKLKFLLEQTKLMKQTLKNDVLNEVYSSG